MYYELMDYLTPEAALLYSYLCDVDPIMKRREGDYFRLSNSFICEVFQTWSDYKIKTLLEELKAKGFIEEQQKFAVEKGSGVRTRWIKVKHDIGIDIKDDTNNDGNNDTKNDTENFGINYIKQINQIEQINHIEQNKGETSSPTSPTSKEELFSEETTLTNCPDPSDKAEKYSAEINEIVAYLNEKTQSSYRTSTGNTRKHIVARLKQCYTVADFKYVIDVKCAEWLNDPKMAQYLRPETLFTERNFENYLQQKMPAAKTAARAGQPNTQYKQANLADLCDETY